MGKYAPVVPISLARKLKELDLLGNYHLLLAHDVLAKPKEYAEVYGDIPDATIIMDNSLIELGRPLEMTQVVEACQVVGAKYAVAPDILEEAEATYKLICKALDDLDRLGAHVLPVPVLQGKTLEEYDWLLERFAEMIPALEFCGPLAIPRVAVKTFGTRAKVIEKARGYDWTIHLLGFSDNLLDDIACARMPGVLGIDSAVPIRLAVQQQQGLTLDAPVVTGPRLDYWDRDWESLVNIANYRGHKMSTNVRRIRQWISQGWDWDH